MAMDSENISKYVKTRRQIRLVILLDSAHKAGLVPIPIMRLHAFAFLANVLAPVWDLEPLEGKVLKNRGGPFYPRLQEDLDEMVGHGLAIITDLSHKMNKEGSWRLEGSYQLNFSFANKIIETIDNFYEEHKMKMFIQELAYALSALGDDKLDMAILEDATYADPTKGLGNVIDFAEWRDQNYSKNAAQLIDSFLDYPASPGKKLHLYVRHLYRRAQSE